ncbi:MAG: DUF3109 family protein [Candidatus Riflebacteria bacterium]|nr:DUF3109 family protein [Candidatus Riflebacteria bacterium]
MTTSNENSLVVNLCEAKFRCCFPECGGVCCKNGRPGLDGHEIALIERNLAKFKPLMRPHAVEVLEAQGFVTGRTKENRRTMAVVDGWCIFANEGCILQKAGEADGAKWKYKPHLCVLFPISQDGDGAEWYVRQKGYRGEAWKLYCIEKTATEKTPAMKGLEDELAYLREYNKKHGFKHCGKRL